MNPIGIITYDHPHLKTERVFHKMLIQDPGIIKRLHFFALPYVQRKTRDILFAHRPDQATGIHPREIASRFNIPYNIVNDDREISCPGDLYIILGAGLLSAECIQNKKLINAHAGIIPLSRGLDSFKWAIINKKPLGVTLHFIDKNVDAGEVISVIETPVYHSDTLETLARRHYENELDILANYKYYLDNPVNMYKNAAAEPSTRRMPRAVENSLPGHFPAYKELFAIQDPYKG